MGMDCIAASDPGRSALTISVLVRLRTGLRRRVLGSHHHRLRVMCGVSAV